LRKLDTLLATDRAQVCVLDSLSCGLELMLSSYGHDNAASISVKRGLSRLAEQILRLYYKL